MLSAVNVILKLSIIFDVNAEKERKLTVADSVTVVRLPRADCKEGSTKVY